MIRSKNSRKSPVVHVIAFRKTSDASVEVRVTPDVLDMTQFVKGEHIITWKLDTLGFQFPADGSAIKITSPGADKSFGCVEIRDDGRVAKVRNQNGDGLAYAYNVTVIETATGQKTVLDPSIGNRSNL